MLRLIRASVIAIALALLMPGVAGAIPIAFEFSGFVDKTGGFPGLAEGDPLTATFSYDTDGFTKADDDGDNIFYSGGVTFDVRAGAYSWSAGPYMRVWKAGDRVDIGLLGFDSAFASLEGPGLLPPGGGAPTSINFAAMTSQTLFTRDLEHTLSGLLTSVVQTQGPDVDPVPAPEPATLTLSALGLAALVARRQARRARM